MLTKERVLALLIDYDVEHPKTLGEMADRRSIYAQRLVDMANESVVPQKFRYSVGDDVSRDYVFENPFKSTDVLASLYRNEDNQQYTFFPDIYKDRIELHFAHPMRVNEATLVLIG